MNELQSILSIKQRYDVFFCDVWGVLHNGVQAYQNAVDALKALRAEGKCVILLTNSPRVGADVATQLEAFGILCDAYDGLVTSGDATRNLIKQAPRRLFHIGLERDINLFDGFDIELVEEREADGVVCTGLFDDNVETLEVYAKMLRRLHVRDLPFICANPDIAVRRGDDLIWCAGALARDYAQLGGRTLVAGKPHLPIYNLAMEKAKLHYGDISKNRVLAIGDGLQTDIKGAENFAVDAVYIAEGVHAAEYMRGKKIDVALFDDFMKKYDSHPVAFMRALCI